MNGFSRPTMRPTGAGREGRATWRRSKSNNQGESDPLTIVIGTQLSQKRFPVGHCVRLGQVEFWLSPRNRPASLALQAVASLNGRAPFRERKGALHIRSQTYSTGCRATRTRAPPRPTRHYSSTAGPSAPSQRFGGHRKGCQIIRSGNIEWSVRLNVLSPVGSIDRIGRHL